MNLGSFCSWYDSLNELIRLSWVINCLLEELVSDSSISYVIHDRVVEKNTILRHDGNVRPKISQRHFFDVLSVYQDLSALNIVESVEEPHYCTFSGACLAYYAH
jgi:hypothetical protein